MTPTTREPHAVVTSGSVRRVLQPGESLTFGRGTGHDLRIGHSPVDLRIPRYAGRLECRPDGVLVHNTSDKRTILAETFPGPSFDILPLMLVGTSPHELVSLVIRGETGTRYAITVDTTPLRAARPAAEDTTTLTDAPTVGYRRIESLTGRQRTMLCALCLPEAFGWGGQKLTPTYSEMERILTERGYRATAKSVRNVLDELRRELADVHGVQGVHEESADGTGGGKQSYLPELARWARLSGNVTDEELEVFDARDSNPGQ